MFHNRQLKPIKNKKIEETRKVSFSWKQTIVETVFSFHPQHWSCGHLTHRGRGPRPVCTKFLSHIWNFVLSMRSKLQNPDQVFFKTPQKPGGRVPIATNTFQTPLRSLERYLKILGPLLHLRRFFFWKIKPFPTQVFFFFAGEGDNSWQGKKLTMFSIDRTNVCGYDMTSIFLVHVKFEATICMFPTFSPV